MNYPIDFFRDEVRCGFYIPTAIKQVWAAELTILSEIDRICEKYGIRYFANYGTFLGAVRHGGFVPWDDDLDLCMLRDDYNRFREVADAELPEKYAIHDYERKEGHWLLLARVVNRDRISFAPEDLNLWHNYPYLAGVDIFIKDYLYPEEKEERARDDEILRILALADGIVEGRLRKEAIEKQLSETEAQYHIRFDRSLDTRHMGIELYRLAEKQMSRVSAGESDQIQQIYPGMLKDWKGQPKVWYEKNIRIPFEGTTVPVPEQYDTVLRDIYGDYTVVRKAAVWHDYPYFETQREELQSHADFKLPCFFFERNLLRPRDVSTWDSPHKRVVLFLAAGPMWWKSLDPWYRKESADPEAEVIVAALPLLFKDCYGDIIASDEELAMAAREAEYPDDLNGIAWYDIDVEEILPDRIYIQDVYDGENPCLTVPTIFYASHVRKYTKELVFVPPFEAEDFTPEDGKDVIVMKYYVTAPGVAYADRVWLNSPVIRKRYLEKLIAWAGEDTRGYWERKLKIIGEDHDGIEVKKSL